MNELDEPELETVYIAGNVREAEAIETLFEAEEIEYELAPCAFEHSMNFGGVFAGVSFAVLSGQASYCRHILAQRGYRKGIV